MRVGDVSDVTEGWAPLNAELCDRVVDRETAVPYIRERACCKSELWAAVVAFINRGWRVLIRVTGWRARVCNCAMLRIAVAAASDTRCEGWVIVVTDGEGGVRVVTTLGAVVVC